MELWKEADQVTTKQDFIAFILALKADRENAENPTPEGNTGGWHNGSIWMFLDAMAAWAPCTSSLTGEPMVGERPEERHGCS